MEGLCRNPHWSIDFLGNSGELILSSRIFETSGKEVWLVWQIQTYYAFQTCHHNLWWFCGYDEIFMLQLINFGRLQLIVWQKLQILITLVLTSAKCFTVGFCVRSETSELIKRTKGFVAMVSVADIENLWKLECTCAGVWCCDHWGKTSCHFFNYLQNLCIIWKSLLAMDNLNVK